MLLLVCSVDCNVTSYADNTVEPLKDLVHLCLEEVLRDTCQMANASSSIFQMEFGKLLTDVTPHQGELTNSLLLRQVR